jgi:hypothetical protein
MTNFIPPQDSVFVNGCNYSLIDTFGLKKLKVDKGDILLNGQRFNFKQQFYPKNGIFVCVMLRVVNLTPNPLTPAVNLGLKVEGSNYIWPIFLVKKQFDVLPPLSSSKSLNKAQAIFEVYFDVNSNIRSTMGNFIQKCLVITGPDEYGVMEQVEIKFKR